MRSRRHDGGAARAALVAGVTVLAGLGVIVALAVALPLAFQEESSSSAAAAARPASLAEARTAVDRAVAALDEGDREAWRTALPASGQAARRASSELFAALADLPWTSLAATVEPVPSRPSCFDIRLVGELAGVGPEDRLIARRVLRLEVLGGRVVVTDDVTLRQIRDQYVMAYRDPQAVEHEACVVLTEPRYRELAEDLAAAAGEARGELARLGVDPDRRVLLYLYASREQLRDALGGGPTDRRFEFFSAPAQRDSADPWWPRDVNVLAPALDDQEDWLPRLLAHEMTHAFTVEWFADTRNDPVFLAEGLAVAVEGGRSYDPLREALAAGEEVTPLTTAFALASLWTGNSDDEVELAYLEAGSVVLYVLDEWGLAGLRRFVTGVADSRLTPADLDAAVRETLGVTWDAFVAGWKEYVQTLP